MFWRLTSPFLNKGSFHPATAERPGEFQRHGTISKLFSKIFLYIFFYFLKRKTNHLWAQLLSEQDNRRRFCVGAKGQIFISHIFPWCNSSDSSESNNVVFPFFFHYHAWFQGGYLFIACKSLTRSVHIPGHIGPDVARLNRKCKEELFLIPRAPAFGFVWLRPGETELSNKNKSQINYGPEQGARQFVLALYALQTFCLQCFDSRRMIWMQEWWRAKVGCLTGLTGTISLLE